MTSEAIAIDTGRAHEVAMFMRVGLAPNLHGASATVRRLVQAADLADLFGDTSMLLDDAERQLLELGQWIAARATAAGAADVFSAGLSGSFDQMWGFLTGDVAQVWNGGDDGFPAGQVAAGLVRVFRVGGWLTGPAGSAITVISNGGLGNLLSRGLTRFPATATAGQWLASPGAASTFRWLGVAGSATSTVAGAYNLWQQGNPIDAFEREGAGYVADVAGTAFSASTTAFLLAPNPVTGGLVVVTGVVWAGAEIVDHWEEISEWTSDRLDDVGHAAGAVWDAGTGAIDVGWSAAGDAMSGALDGATNLASGAADIADDFVSVGFEIAGDALGGVTGAIGGLFG